MSKSLPWPRKAEDGVTPLGVDVNARHEDVRLIVLKHFQAGHGLDLGDLVQTVYLSILTKNRQPSAYDPRRGSLSHYIYLVAASALRNMLRAQKTFDAHHLYIGDPCADELGTADGSDPIGAWMEATEDETVDVRASRRRKTVVRRAAPAGARTRVVSAESPQIGPKGR